MLVVYTLVCVLLCGAVHEAGHWIVARLMGYSIQFRRSGFRFIWNMPVEATPRQKRIIAISGFGLELLAVIPVIALNPNYGLLYQMVADAHFIAYTFYAGDYNDFQFLT
jgi:hypothetical protein